MSKIQNNNVIKKRNKIKTERFVFKGVAVKCIICALSSDKAIVFQFLCNSFLIEKFIF